MTPGEEANSMLSTDSAPVFSGVGVATPGDFQRSVTPQSFQQSVTPRAANVVGLVFLRAALRDEDYFDIVGSTFHDGRETDDKKKDEENATVHDPGGGVHVVKGEKNLKHIKEIKAIRRAKGVVTGRVYYDKRTGDVTRIESHDSA